jgi:two-component system nitrogen regulation response regulator GlnG
MDGTVLIADDDRTIRTVLTQALTRAGCRVHATGSLAQLMRWVEEGKGDLVITDVMMPDGNGIDMIPAIRSAARPAGDRDLGAEHHRHRHPRDRGRGL